MNITNKIVFITGASSGIGQACAEEFARLGAKLLLCARREDRLQALAKDLTQRFNVKIHTFKCDVSNTDSVEKSFAALPAEWRDIDILINNAGLAAGIDKIQDGKLEDWDVMIDTNIKGVLYVTRLVLGQMLKRNQGHIINLGSISAYQVYAGGSVYCATKFAIQAISEGIKMDVHGTPIRVSQINPGMVETEYAMVRFKGDKEKFASVYRGLTPLTAKDVAEAIVFCATRPAHVDVRDINIYPTAQTAALMIHREDQ
jgi:NADP-dependent 3-hydroxy acid dehydrogenase YdfG